MLRPNNFLFLVALLFEILLINAGAIARAEWTTLPESHHQLFQTYGLFFEEQTTLVYRQPNRAWGGIAAVVAAMDNEEWRWKPQFVIHGSANASFEFNSKGDTLLTETVDARVGLAVDLTFTGTFRGSVIWTHQSGHISDNVPDRTLFGSNLGNEVLTFRVIKDVDNRFRFGGSFRPTLGSDPGMLAFGAEQFAEWFFHGENPDPHKFAPFVAVGFEQYGRHAIRLTSHAQIGFSAGSHFSANHRPTMRVMLGYYNGNDPQMKYYQFRFRRADFFYGGMMFDI